LLASEEIVSPRVIYCAKARREKFGTQRENEQVACREEGASGWTCHVRAAKSRRLSEVWRKAVILAM
jgi:hypothetical protein